MGFSVGLPGFFFPKQNNRSNFDLVQHLVFPFFQDVLLRYSSFELLSSLFFFSCSDGQPMDQCFFFFGFFLLLPYPSFHPFDRSPVRRLYGCCFGWPGCPGWSELFLWVDRFTDSHLLRRVVCLGCFPPYPSLTSYFFPPVYHLPVRYVPLRSAFLRKT